MNKLSKYDKTKLNDIDSGRCSRNLYNSPRVWYNPFKCPCCNKDIGREEWYTIVTKPYYIGKERRSGHTNVYHKSCLKQIIYEFKNGINF